ncbi:MAG TPA: hypothetical protein PLJ42_09745 [Chitinophagales bacterium]|jgi:predicted house-cleaning NTP pyrophosphatase (Maf/HAM1 superfamily)|nr:hypothetical protein [Chitinophagales bacterium]MBP6154302.1 hypothetical protein [Chitinophagales bacterium]HQV77205.1 hypothetical protein [Chitinophagales bacterium]HQW79704.1 hypothetical protein [Chitinophagales bacterium]HRB19188.1 hypothetical protein [Chitinophagales bacterium]
METLILKSTSRKRIQLLQNLAIELGVITEHKNSKKSAKVSEISMLSEKALSKEWLSKEEEAAWKNL